MESNKQAKLAKLKQKLSQNRKKQKVNNDQGMNFEGLGGKRQNFSDFDEGQVYEMMDEDKNTQPPIEDPFDDEFEQEVVEKEASEHSSDFETDSEDNKNQSDKLYFKKEKKTKEDVTPFIGNEKQISENQYLDYDNSAYYMLHRANVEWPCLSCDFISGIHPVNKIYSQPNLPKIQDFEYPLEIFAVAGSQASLPSKNRLYVLRMSNMYQTKHDDDDDGAENQEAEDPFESEPIIMSRAMPIKGGINRIRSMSTYPLVAVWNEARKVQIYDLKNPLKELQDIQLLKENKKKFIKESKDFSLISQFKSNSEGFGLDWSPLEVGHLLSGSCDGLVKMYLPDSEFCSGFREEGKGWSHHQDSVEDIQWAPNDVNGFATCSVDGTVQIVDKRQPDRSKSAILIQAHDVDVNVISWNRIKPNLIASGDDVGQFKVWDIRYPDEEPISFIHWHESAITSIEWDRYEEWTLAVASADNRVSFWDFGVEEDDQGESMNPEVQIPSQMIFLHQGQDDIKEIRWHPSLANTMLSTAANGFNIFQPGVNQEDSLNDSEEENKLELIPEQVPGGDTYYETKLKNKILNKKDGGMMME